MKMMAFMDLFVCKRIDRNRAEQGDFGPLISLAASKKWGLFYAALLLIYPNKNKEIIRNAGYLGLAYFK